MTKRLISTIKVLNEIDRYGYIECKSTKDNSGDYSFKLDELSEVSLSDLKLGSVVSFIPREWENERGEIKRFAMDIKLIQPSNDVQSFSKLNEELNNVLDISDEPTKHKSESSYLLPNGGINDSELIIGIVSAVGTETQPIIDKLRQRLTGFGYKSEVIKVSHLIKCEKKFSDREESQRIEAYMELGDKYREKSDNNAILAAGAICEIHKYRSKREVSHSKDQKFAYIINSLKHPSEVELLRKVYGQGFYLIGIHADEHLRLEHLIRDMHCKEEDARELISLDEDEKVKHGQKTRDTFHLSDFFLNYSMNSEQVVHTLQRFLELIFSHPHKHPTFNEYSMFMAFNSSIRSGDLSRQVGAVLSRNNQILATGANDVPKAGGGLYWAYEDSNGEIIDCRDGKDYMRQKDPNKEVQIKIVQQIMKSIQDNENIDLEDFQEEAIEKILNSSKIGDLTEFGRVVHAEMEAILSCSREGISTTDAILYCTTFPCHNCAKHIVASGIKKVVYVEPYPKSMALELHGDAIELKELIENNPSNVQENNDKVIFESFVGVGPRRFLDLFSMTLGMGAKLKRKNKVTGKALSWSQDTSQIRTPLLSKSYLELEDDIIAIWDNRKYQ